MAKSKKAEQGFALYIQGKTYKEIAEALGVAESTVRSWKCNGGWRLDGTSAKKHNIGKRKNKSEQIMEAAIKETFSNNALSPQQQMFCAYYIKSFNATQSYLKAYDCDYETAHCQGYRLLANPRIKEEIERLKDVKRKLISFTEEDLVEYHMRIAFGDVGNYVTFGREVQPVMALYGPVMIKDEETGEKKMVTEEVNVVKLKESNKVDTQLIQELKIVKGDVSIKLMDRHKSLEWLDKHFLMNPMDKHKIEYDKAKHELDVIKTELQIKDNNVATETGEDNFLEALNAIAGKVWEDE